MTLSVSAGAKTTVLEPSFSIAALAWEILNVFLCGLGQGHDGINTGSLPWLGAPHL